MFQNPFRGKSSVDPFHEQASPEVEQSGPEVELDPAGDPGIHHVDPHYVQDYERADGTHVDGYWRDGDGDTSHDLTPEEGGGYDQSNPDGDPFNNLG